MCEYCGCQANRAIELLTTEHDRALDHVRDLEDAARAQDTDRARPAGAALAAVLAPHTAVEEQALFPALAEEFGEHVRELLHEHELVEHTLAELTGASQPSPGWDVRLLHAMDVLRNHILKEQDGVFPAALSILDAKDWDHMDQVRNRFDTETAPAGRHRRPLDQPEDVHG